MNLVPQRDPQRYSQLTCHGHNCLSQMILNQFAACGAPGRVKEFREQSSRISCIAYDDAVQHVPAAAGFAANSGLGARQSANCLTRVRPHSLTCSSAQPNICSNVRSPVARAAGSFRTSYPVKTRVAAMHVVCEARFIPLGCQVRQRCYPKTWRRARKRLSAQGVSPRAASPT